jgi:hypothetical protein
MRNADRHPISSEMELARMNASADANLWLGADDWNDAVAAADLECARLCQSLALAVDMDFD